MYCSSRIVGPEKHVDSHVVASIRLSAGKHIKCSNMRSVGMIICDNYTSVDSNGRQAGIQLLRCHDGNNQPEWKFLR